MTQKVENKTTKLMLTKTLAAKYSDLIYTLVNQPVKQGITTAEIRRDIRILDEIEKNKKEETLDLRKEDIVFISTLISTYEWGVRHIDLLDFEDYFIDLSK